MARLPSVPFAFQLRTPVTACPFTLDWYWESRPVLESNENTSESPLIYLAESGHELEPSRPLEAGQRVIRLTMPSIPSTMNKARVLALGGRSPAETSS